MRFKEKWYKKIVAKYRNSKAKILSKKMHDAIKKCPDKIPTIIVSYNNGVYVDNIVSQLSNHSITPIIIDNKSTHQGTLGILEKIERLEKGIVVYSNKNFGHMVGFLEPIYKTLPEIFAYTDPDLELNQNLPINFIEIMRDLTNEYQVYKVGLALDLLYDQQFVKKTHTLKRQKPFSWQKDVSIRDIEEKYWRKKIQHKEFELYAASTDTTFSVYNKKNFNGDFYDSLRIADTFSAIHLPWFPELDLMNDLDRAQYMQKNKSTTSI